VLAVALGEAAGIFFVLQTAILATVVGAAALGRRTGIGLLPLSAAFLAVVAFRSLAVWACRRASFSCASLVMGEARRDILARLRRLGPVELADRRAGEIALTLVDAVDSLEPYFSRYLPQRAIATLLPFTILAAVFPLDWISGLVLVFTAVFLPLSMILIGEETHARYQRLWAVLARLSGSFLDSLQGLATLKLFGAARAEAARVAAASEEYRGATMSVLKIAFLSSFMLELVSALSIAIVAVISGFRLLSGSMAFAPAYFILLAAPEYFLALRALGTHYHARMDALSAAERIRELLGADSAREPGALRAEEPSGKVGAPGPSGRPPLRTSPPEQPPGQPGPARPCALVFEEVSFSYGERRILEGASFNLEAGASVAIMGPSGSGKSTIISGILGFLQPSAGRILVDGRELSGLESADWLPRVAWLPQRPSLFHGTIRDNIRLGRLDAGEDEILEAARLAQVGEFLARLPGGLDSRVGEGGSGLSSGQIQRLALARLFLRDPSIVLLDEPTAHLDAESALLVEEGIAALSEGRSLVLVTHRAAPRIARVLHLEGGRLREGR
jgi:ATP-binding cassette subfamily C protein CydD